MPATQRNWSQLRKMKPYWSLLGNWVTPASSLIKPWENDFLRDNHISAHLAFFNNRHQLMQCNCTDLLLRLQEHPGRFFHDLHLLTNDKKKLGNLLCKAGSHNCLDLHSAANTVYIFMSQYNLGLSTLNTAWLGHKKRNMVLLLGWRDNVHVQELPMEGEAQNIFTVPRGNSLTELNTHISAAFRSC